MPLENRIPTLDGWRGIAILMVLSEHFVLSFIKHSFRGDQFSLLGQHGVSIFFVLSGYLITSNLLARDRISLKQFYVRRFFRLMPAAWTFLLCLSLLTFFTPLKTIGDDVWGCLFFFRNYVTPLGAYSPTQHFWSLSVEEQFYLVWPALLLLLGRKNAAWFTALGALAIASFRLMHWNVYAQHYCWFGRTEICADKLMIGCLLALLLKHDWAKRWFQHRGTQIFLVCLIPLIADFYFFRQIIPLHEGVLIALMVGATAARPQMLAGRVLETPFLKITGLMSYSIYLWQQLLFRDNWGPLAFILLPLVAMLSWRFIEQPGIELGRALTRKSRISLLAPESEPVDA